MESFCSRAFWVDIAQITTALVALFGIYDSTQTSEKVTATLRAISAPYVTLGLEWKWSYTDDIVPTYFVVQYMNTSGFPAKIQSRKIASRYGDRPFEVAISKKGTFDSPLTIAPRTATSDQIPIPENVRSELRKPRESPMTAPNIIFDVELRWSRTDDTDKYVFMASYEIIYRPGQKGAPDFITLNESLKKED